VAGDLALVFLARGGVYLAGGITPRLPANLFDAPFIETFNAKAEHAALMAGMPVWAVTVDDIGLRGALALVA
jgi:glucokinase